MVSAPDEQATAGKTVPQARATIGRPTATARHVVNAFLSDNTRRAYAGALGQLDAWLPATLHIRQP